MNPAETSNLTAKLMRSALLAVSVAAILLAFLPWYSHHLQIESLRHAENGDQAKALQVAEKAVWYNPFSVQGLFILAGAQQRLGRIEEARKTLIRTTELQPENYATWEQLAIYEANFWDEPEAAREHLQEAMRLNPQDEFIKSRFEDLGLGEPAAPGE